MRVMKGKEAVRWPKGEMAMSSRADPGEGKERATTTNTNTHERMLRRQCRGTRSLDKGSRSLDKGSREK
jgi:hypothetical protein